MEFAKVHKLSQKHTHPCVTQSIEFASRIGFIDLFCISRRCLTKTVGQIPPEKDQQAPLGRTGLPKENPHHTPHVRYPPAARDRFSHRQQDSVRAFGEAHLARLGSAPVCVPTSTTKERLCDGNKVYQIGRRVGLDLFSIAGVTGKEIFLAKRCFDGPCPSQRRIVDLRMIRFAPIGKMVPDGVFHLDGRPYS